MEWEDFQATGGQDNLKQVLSTEWFEPMKHGIEHLDLELDLEQNVELDKTP